MSRLRLGFVSEGVLGHSTLQAQLERQVPHQPGVEAWFETVGPPGRLGRAFTRRLGVLGSLDLHDLRWKLRYSAAARELLRRHLDETDAVLLNSHSCALLATGELRRVPGVLSVDVTGRQFARLEYHRPRDRFSALGDGLVFRLEQRAFAAATTLVAWSDSVAASLRDEYGVEEEQLAVLHPGLDLPPRAGHREREAGDPFTLLFIGNETRRKGLDVLLEALAGGDPRLRLDVVTNEAVAPSPRVAVHAGVTPVSEAMRRLLAAADALALPTRADAAPWVLLEGMAAGLPTVSTTVGSIPELLGDAGVTVPAGDSSALATALTALADDPAECRRLGEAGRRRVEEHFDAARNLPRLIELMRAAATRRGAPA